MRSSKNRSRSKGNRNRNGQGGGNIVNRVFDSSGPEGKVRGTPQQIVEKYNQLTRDAQLSNDRVAAESFQQHAEHYLRMLAEAQREQDAKAAQQQANQQHTNQGGGQQSGGGNQGGGNQQGAQDNSGQGGGNQGSGNRRKRTPRGGDDQQPRVEDQQQPVVADQPKVEAQGSFDAVIEPSADDSGLVETPESAPKPKRARTRRRKPDAPEGGDDKAPQDAAE